MRTIDADALLAILEEEAKGLETLEFQLAAVACINHIKEAPTIEDEPVRRGHWLYTEAWPHRVYCSVCFRTYALKHWQVWEDGSLARAYCPNCGVRMDGESDE